MSFISFIVPNVSTNVMVQENHSLTWIYSIPEIPFLFATFSQLILKQKTLFYMQIWLLQKLISQKKSIIAIT